MTDNWFGELLRSAREDAGLSLTELSELVHFSRSLLGHVETGYRSPNATLALSLDRVFQTTPLFISALNFSSEVDPMKRRSLIGAVAVAIAGGSMERGGVLANTLRQGLLQMADSVEDWDHLVEDYWRRSMSSPGTEYGQSLLAQIMAARQQQLEHSAFDLERAKAMANLTQLYGLWLGDCGDAAGARGWYRTASVLADRSGDDSTRAYVRGLALSQGVYEGATAKETIDGASKVMSISGKSLSGVLEAQSALVHVHALTENLAAGRQSIRKMKTAVDKMADSQTSGIAVPYARTVVFENYLECRIGSRKTADKTYEEVSKVARSMPMWYADASISYGRALVRSGDVRDGLNTALIAARKVGPDLRTSMRVVGLGVRDLISVVPAEFHSDELEELSTFAPSGPVPWETIA